MFSSQSNRKEYQLLLVSQAHDFDFCSGTADGNQAISSSNHSIPVKIHWAEVQSVL
jgi:hypothetical protein